MTPIVASRRSVSGRSIPVTRGLLARPGFAMFMALGALVIVAVLIAGSTFITTQEARLGQNQLVQSRAMAAAEYGLNKIQADWDKTPNLQMANGATFDTQYTIVNQGLSRVRYVRLNNETFYILSEGRATVGNSASAARTAVKRVGAILRLRIPTIKAEGAVTTAGNVNAGGNAHILGNDSTPPGWSGCTSNTDKAALVVGTQATVDLPNGANANNVAGSPMIDTSELATDSNTYVRFGDETWYQLVAGANHTLSSLSGGTPTTNSSDGSCKKTDAGNWGEPWRTGDAVAACYTYFPIIYVNTNATVSGGRGQGILLVNGDFKFGGGFEWYGLVIVKDDIKKGNGTSTIHGGIMARNALQVGSGENTEELTGTVNLLYSGCALERAMLGSAQVLQAKHRAWTELFEWEGGGRREEGGGRREGGNLFPFPLSLSGQATTCCATFSASTCSWFATRSASCDSSRWRVVRARNSKLAARRCRRSTSSSVKIGPVSVVWLMVGSCGQACRTATRTGPPMQIT